MHLLEATLLTLLFVSPLELRAQIPEPMVSYTPLSRTEVGANFDYLHANAPPGQCGCFSLYGGNGTVLVNVTSSWSGLADVTVARASNVDNSGQNIMIVNYLFGPRYSWRRHRHYTLYGEVLVGGAKEQVNFDFAINRNSFGVLGGGGVSRKLKPKWGVNIVEVDYVYTRIPNAVNNTQNNLRISTGFTYHFGGE